MATHTQARDPAGLLGRLRQLGWSTAETPSRASSVTSLARVAGFSTASAMAPRDKGRAATERLRSAAVPVRARRVDVSSIYGDAVDSGSEGP